MNTKKYFLWVFLYVFFYFFSERAHLNIFVFPVNLLETLLLETNVVMSGNFFSLSVASSELCWGIRNYSWSCTHKGHFSPPLSCNIEKKHKKLPHNVILFILYDTYCNSNGKLSIF